MGLKDFFFFFSLFLLFLISETAIEKSLRDRKGKNCLNIIILFLLIIMVICHKNKTTYTSLLPLCSSSIKHTGAADVQLVAIKDFFPATYGFFADKETRAYL